MEQARVFYANCVESKETKKFEEKLRAKGIEFDSIEGIEDLRKEQYTLEKRIFINEIFNLDYLFKMKDYNLLIEHLGVISGKQCQDFLKNYPNLYLVRVSEFSNVIVAKENRFLLCSYDSEELFPFIKQALNGKK